MHLNDALACQSRIQAVPCHHEQACAIAAEAYGRTGHTDNRGLELQWLLLVLGQLMPLQQLQVPGLIQFYL